jgi:hypothetical protein
MRPLGAVLITGGAAVWIVGVLASMSGVWVTLPPDTVRILVLSLIAVSGGSLVGAGALIARGRQNPMLAPPPGIAHGSGAEPQLSSGGAPASDLHAGAASVGDRVT